MQNETVGPLVRQVLRISRQGDRGEGPAEYGASWMVHHGQYRSHWVPLNLCSLCLQASTFLKNDSLDKGNARPLQHGEHSGHWRGPGSLQKPGQFSQLRTSSVPLIGW